MKMIIILAVVMVVEGVILGAGYFIFGDKPPTVHAEGLQVDPKADEFKLVEVLLIGDKFQNTRQGAQAYLYDATIYVVVQQRHRGEIEIEISSGSSSETSQIIRMDFPAATIPIPYVWSHFSNFDNSGNPIRDPELLEYSLKERTRRAGGNYWHEFIMRPGDTVRSMPLSRTRSLPGGRAG